ncbi:hypothetical protein V8E36_007348 [Tilletia maclaganii]
MVITSQPPIATGFAAWEHPNGSARPHTADAMFGPAAAAAAASDDTSANAPAGSIDNSAGLHPPHHHHHQQHHSVSNTTPARPPLLSNYSSGTGGRVFAYMPTSTSDEFTSPGGYASFDSSYSPYQAPDTASTSTNPNFTSTINTADPAAPHRGSSGSVSTATGEDGGNTSSITAVSPLGPIISTATKKRPRRRYDEIDRMYPCNWPGCTKSYGTLNHLNAHVTMQKHGAKRLPNEFKELRKQWRKTKREDDNRRQQVARIANSAPHTGTGAAANGTAGVNSSAFTAGVPMVNGAAAQQHHLTPGGVADDSYLRASTRMDSFSSAPGGYAGDAYSSSSSSAAYYPSYPRGSVSSAYSYATAPPGTGTSTTGAGHWVTPYGTPAGAAGTAGNGSHNMFPPPSGPARSYSMGAAGTAPLNGASSSSSSGGGAFHPVTSAATGGWSSHSYASGPPPPYANGANPNGYHHPAYAGSGGAYAGSGGYGGSGGMSAPSTSAGPTGGPNGDGGANSSSNGQAGSSSSGAGGALSGNSAAAHVGGLGAYLMAHRGSI